MALNILHIIYAKEWGGGETAALSMIKKQIESGYNVIILLDKKSYSMRNRFLCVENIIDIDFSNMVKCVLSLHKIVVEYDINIIHTHTGRVIPVAILAKLNTNAKLIAFRHNVLKNKNDVVHRIIYRNIDAFVCVSNKVYEQQVSTVENSLKKRFYMVYNGIDENLYENGIYHKSTDTLICGFAGRIDESKGVHYLLATMTQLKEHDIVLKIAGDSDNEYGRDLKQFTIENKLESKVEWLGFQESMPEFYSSLDVLLAPSIIPEAFGLVLCEAMYCNCAVISSNSGAQHEIIDDGANGILLKNINVDEILNSILLYYNDRKLLSKHRNAAKEKVKTMFTMDCWMKKMSEIYTEILVENKH